MGRRVLVVIAFGATISAAATFVAWQLDPQRIDFSVWLPRAVGLACVVITLLVATMVIVHDRVLDKAQQETDKMTARLRDREHALVHSNRELERFATIAAHDLQEPLRTILTFSDLIDRKFGETIDPDARAYLLRVSLAGARMRDLIEDLLIYARIGQAERRYQTVDLQAVVDDAIANVEQLIAETHATIDVGDMPTVTGNLSGLKQLFTNLLSNAMKYRLGDRPKVTIAAQLKDDEWIVSVADNGKGIDPAHHERIFELFRRLETREGAAGTGLGLAICTRVVSAHGGRIWVKSSLGTGATFYFTLPTNLEAGSDTELDGEPL